MSYKMPHRSRLDSRKYEPVSRDDCVRGLSLALFGSPRPFSRAKGRVRDKCKPVAVGVNAHLSPSSSPLRKGRGERRGDKARVTIAEATSRPRHGERAMVVPHQEDFLL